MQAFNSQSHMEITFYRERKKLIDRMEEDRFLGIKTSLNEHEKMLLKRYKPKRIDNDADKAMYVAVIAIAISLVSLYFSLTSLC